MIEFETKLAAIIALTQPVSNKHNPFFLNKFYEQFTWAADSDWQCKENCEAAQELLSSPAQHHRTELIPLKSGLRFFGCYLCRYQFDGRFKSGTCHKNTEKTKELMIAFVNTKTLAGINLIMALPTSVSNASTCHGCVRIGRKGL